MFGLNLVSCCPNIVPQLPSGRVRPRTWGPAVAVAELKHRLSCSWYCTRLLVYFFGGFVSVYLSGRMYIAASSCFFPVLRSTWYTSDSGWFGSKIVESLIQSQCRKCYSPVTPSPIDWNPAAVAAAGSLHCGIVLIVDTSSCFAIFACCF